jgi:hypothetical protein
VRPINLDVMIEVAIAVEPLGLHFVFTGACVLPFLIAPVFVPSLRTTKDVDLIVQIMARTQMADVEEKLRSIGFRNDWWTEGAHRCRWLFNDIYVDVMSDGEDKNSCPSKWFGFAAQTAVSRDVGAGIIIRHVSAVGFLATKLDAFLDRGSTDMIGSKDMEDIVALIDGREMLLSEVRSAPLEVRKFIALQIDSQLRDNRVTEIVSANLSYESRLAGREAHVMRTLRQISAL